MVLVLAGLVHGAFFMQYHDKENNTLGRYYPPGVKESLCISCINKELDCTWEGRYIVRCPMYIKTSSLFDQVIGK